MKEFHIKKIFVLGVVMMLVSCGSAGGITKCKDAKVDVDKAFKQVYKATQEVMAEVDDSKMTLKSVDLSFATTTEFTQEYAAKVYVISGEFKKNQSRSKAVTYTFKQAETKLESFTEDKNIKEFKEYLKSVLNTAKGVTGEDTFALQEIEVNVEFTITCSKALGGEIELVPVTPSVKLDRTKQAVHSITVKLQKTEKK